jgi:hypothetical protein
MDIITEAAESFLPAPTAAPDALSGNNETLEEAEYAYSFWDHLEQSDIVYFKLPLLDQFRCRPYHEIKLEGPILAKQLAHDFRKQTFRSETVLNRSGHAKVDRLLLRMEADVFGYLAGDNLRIYAPTLEEAQTVAGKFRRYVKQQAAAKPCFFIVSVDATGPTTETVEIERLAPVTAEELVLNYGDDFPSWEQGWTERIRRTASGLTIFHGPPGCGKTSYLRALMARLLDKAVFYFIPVSEVAILANPCFVNFWIKQTKRHAKKTKIVLLEDAEELLLPRDIGSRDRVSNLLNLADGFLGDHLKLHVIATTNAPMDRLDPAIARPGRLVGAREFPRLGRDQAMRLALAKGIDVPPDQADYSLAEIYCQAAVDLKASNPRQCGFAK